MTGAFVYYFLVDPKKEKPMNAPPNSGDGIKLINF